MVMMYKETTQHKVFEAAEKRINQLLSDHTEMGECSFCKINKEDFFIYLPPPPMEKIACLGVEFLQREKHPVSELEEVLKAFILFPFPMDSWGRDYDMTVAFRRGRDEIRENIKEFAGKTIKHTTYDWLGDWIIVNNNQGEQHE